MNHKLNIIILSYNTADLVKQLVTKLNLKKPKDWLITVIDNRSSRPGEVTKLKKLTGINLILNKKNLGFAVGNNVALKQNTSPYVLLLNSDVDVDVDAISKALDFLQSKPKAAVVSLKLWLDPQQRRLDWACHRGFPTPWAALTYFLGLEKLLPATSLFSKYHLKYKDLNQPHQIDAISGAFFLAKFDSLKQVGFFDSDYFMYGEDIDLCYRLKQIGKQVWFYPHAQAIHHKHAAGLKSNNPQTKTKTKKYFWQAMLIFYTKHYSQRYPSWFNQLVKIGIKLMSLTNFK